MTLPKLIGWFLVGHKAASHYFIGSHPGTFMCVLHTCIWNIFRYRLAAYVFCTIFYEKTPHYWIIPLTVFALNQKVGAIYLVYSLLWMGVTDNTQRIPIVWTPHISLNYSLCCISQKCAYAWCFSCFFIDMGCVLINYIELKNMHGGKWIIKIWTCLWSSSLKHGIKLPNIRVLVFIIYMLIDFVSNNFNF